MYLLCTLYVAVLFFVLTPGVLLSLPMKGSKYMVAATHALVFAVIYHFTHEMFWKTFYEGFEPPGRPVRAAGKGSCLLVNKIGCLEGQYRTPAGNCANIPERPLKFSPISLKCGTKLTFCGGGSWGCN